MATDESLMEAVKQGDLAQASVLFERYSKYLFNFFVKLSFDRDLGNDLTQNTFLRIIKYRHTYRGDVNFKSWMFRIARNVHADHFRRNKFAKTQFEEVNNIADRLADIDENLVQNEQERLLHLSISQLSEEDREILLLSKFQQMKYKEIAEIYELTETAIKSKVHRAIKRLKEQFFQLENS